MFGIPDAHPKDRGWVLMPRQCGRPGADLASPGAVARAGSSKSESDGIPLSGEC
jgi:hypothetical protein